MKSCRNDARNVGFSADHACFTSENGPGAEERSGYWWTGRLMRRSFMERLSWEGYDTIVEYVRARKERHTPVWLVVSDKDEQFLDASVFELLRNTREPFEPVFEMEDSRGRVVVYELKRRKNARNGGG